MKPTRKVATPPPETPAIESPAAEEAAVVSETPATDPDPAPVEEVERVTEDASETVSEGPVEGGETEVAGGGEAPQTETESEDAVVIAPELAAEEAAVEPPAEPIDDGATSGAWTDMKLGPVECRAKNLTVDEVLACLPQAGIDRVKILTGEHSIHMLANRMLGTDGRCTPAVFSGEDAPEHIIDGYQSIAAAVVAGITEIPVILVEPSRVDFIQSYLSSRHINAAPASTQEDDLLWRVNGLAS